MLIRSFPLLLILTALIGGCTQPLLRNPWKNDGKTFSLFGKKQKPVEPAVAETKSNPPSVKQETSAELKQISAETPAKPVEAPALELPASGTPIEHDAATLALIESTLKDVPPQQREKVWQLLKETPKQMVPWVLASFKTNQMLSPQSAGNATATTARTDKALATISNPGNGLRPEPSETKSRGTLNDTGTNPRVLNETMPAVTTNQSVTVGTAPPRNPWLTNAPPNKSNGESNSLVSKFDIRRGLPDLIPGYKPANLVEKFRPGEATNQGPDANEAAVANEQIDHLASLIAEMEAEVAQLTPGRSESEYLHYIEKNVRLRMLYMISGNTPRALKAINGINPSDQQFWQQMMYGMSNYFDVQGIPNPSDRATQTLIQVADAVSKLRGQANLELRNVCFCQKINGFGDYEKYARDEFAPGETVLVYAEVVNFSSEQMTDGKFRTVLGSVIEFREPGPQGETVERLDFSETTDLCANQRTDYFHSYMVTIPRNLPRGPHALYLTVTDQLQNKIANFQLNLTIR